MQLLSKSCIDLAVHDLANGPQKFKLFSPNSDNILICGNSRLQQAVRVLRCCPGNKRIHRDKVGSLGKEWIIVS